MTIFEGLSVCGGGHARQPRLVNTEGRFSAWPAGMSAREVRDGHCAQSFWGSSARSTSILARFRLNWATAASTSSCAPLTLNRDMPALGVTVWRSGAVPFFFMGLGLTKAMNVPVLVISDLMMTPCLPMT